MWVLLSDQNEDLLFIIWVCLTKPYDKSDYIVLKFLKFIDF
jgi:hypothetical protein